MEFELIDRIRRRVHSRDDVILGIGDDAAVVQVPSDRHLVVATDTLNVGVHFLHDTAPADIGWKALAVNLSDLAAMAAQPAWCSLSLSLPDGDGDWLDGFLDGFLDLAARHRIALIGGDTTQGPLSISVTVHGLVEPGRALRRAGAQVGDDIWITGTLGDAAGALVLRQQMVEPVLACAGEAGPILPADDADDRQDGNALPALQVRLDRPTPRLAVGRGLAGIAHAGIDISDGLLADLGHVCRAGGLGAEILLQALPGSSALFDAFDGDQRHALQTSGGDDYELCFTAAVSRRDAIVALAGETATAITRIGHMREGGNVNVLDADGKPWKAPRTGYRHFE